MFEEMLQPLLTEWLDVFFDPRKRVWWGYLASALVIAVAWSVALRGASLREGLAAVFDRAAWWSRSARADYLLMAINGVLMRLLVPRLLASSTVAYLVFERLHAVFDGRPVLVPGAPAWAVAAGFTAFLFVLDDFARYWVHRALHAVPALWAFHRVHHGATALNPLTVFRTHPVEGVLFALRATLVQGVAIAVFFFLFGERVTLMSVLGANALAFAFNALGANLRHSHVPIGFWRPVERVLMSPAQHQVHHSTAPDHRDRNFGVAFSLWDWLFGTHCHSEPDRVLEFGLGPGGSQDGHRLGALYLRPFSDAARSLLPRSAPADVRHEVPIRS